MLGNEKEKRMKEESTKEKQWEEKEADKYRCYVLGIITKYVGCR